MVSIGVTDKNLIDAFIKNPDNTFLISFPRTGSHWLRMMMELYFERPSLIRVFYYPDRRDYLTLHTHDIDLSVVRRDVVYLYRDPVDTVYSQMVYKKDDLRDADRIRYWSDLYGRHMAKWLFIENFTQHKTIIRYDRLRDDPKSEFCKICEHFGQSLSGDRLMKIMGQVTKSSVSEKTPHDPRVINLETQYENGRQDFRNKYQGVIWNDVLCGRGELSRFLIKES